MNPIRRLTAALAGLAGALLAFAAAPAALASGPGPPPIREKHPPAVWALDRAGDGPQPRRVPAHL
jgi:hypothetical protein